MGALFAQTDGFSDVTSGTGTIVVGLSAVILAEVLIHELTIGGRLLSIGVGGNCLPLHYPKYLRESQT